MASSPLLDVLILHAAVCRTISLTDEDNFWKMSKKCGFGKSDSGDSGEEGDDNDDDNYYSSFGFMATLSSCRINLFSNTKGLQPDKETFMWRNRF